MPQKRNIIVISDAQALGDDGAALALLFASGMCEEVKIVAASGNVWSREACANLRQILSRFGRETVPVLEGLPAKRHEARLSYFEKSERHRSDLGFAGALRLPVPAGDGPDDALLRAFMEAIKTSEKPDILLLAPATLLQAACALHPDLTKDVNRIFAMGGAISVRGNATPQAEFNFWFDPEAADALFGSALPMTLLPLDALEGLNYPQELAPSHRPEAAYIRQYAAKRKGAATPMWDEALAAAYLWPTLIRKSADMHLCAVTQKSEDYGASRAGDAKRRAVQTILELDRAMLAARFQETFAGA